MQRRRDRVRRKDGFSDTVSDLRLIMRLPTVVSFAQLGTSPHRNDPSWRAPSRPTATARTSSVGATLKLASWTATFTSSTRNCSASLSTGVAATYRPHISLGPCSARGTGVSCDSHNRLGTVALMRILVVEDEIKMAGLVKRGLEREGYAVDVASTGEEA